MKKVIKGILLMALNLCCVCILSIDAKAAVDSTNTYRYTNVADGIVLDEYKGTATYLEIPQVIDGYTVVGIGNKFLDNYDTVQELVIPDTATYIEKISSDTLRKVTINGNNLVIYKWAFSYCDALEEVVINDGVTEIGGLSFSACPNLSKVIIGSDVKIIGDAAFDACKSLTSMDIPSNVETIGASAFQNCKALNSVTLHDGLKTIGAGAFYKTIISDLVIPGTVENMEEAFKGMDACKSIKFNEGITSLENAFKGFTCAQEITFPSTVTEFSVKDTKLDDTAWYNEHEPGFIIVLDRIVGYSDGETLADEVVPNGIRYIDSGLDSQAIRSVVIPESVEEINCYIGRNIEELTLPGTIKEITEQFNGQSLKKLTLSEGTVSITANAFKGSTIEEVNFPSTLETIGSAAFYNSTLKEITIPTTVKTVGESAFASCESLEKADIAVEIISEKMFSSCQKLSDVKLSEQVKEISSYAFWDCYSLKNIEFPASVTKIGTAVFQRCTSLEEIRIEETVEKIGEDIFTDCTAMKKAYINTNVIPKSTFAGCETLYEVEIGSNVSEIGDDAFGRCTSLANIYIPSAVKSIGDSAFTGNTNLSSIELNEGLEVIGKWAFWDTIPTEVTIPSTVGSIGENAVGAELYKYTDLVLKGNNWVEVVREKYRGKPGFTLYGSTNTARQYAEALEMNYQEITEPIETEAVQGTISDDAAVDDEKNTNVQEKDNQENFNKDIIGNDSGIDNEYDSNRDDKEDESESGSAIVIVLIIVIVVLVIAFAVVIMMMKKSQKSSK